MIDPRTSPSFRYDRIMYADFQEHMIVLILMQISVLLDVGHGQVPSHFSTHRQIGDGEEREPCME